MAPEFIDGLWCSLIIAAMTIVVCPMLCWLLPDRSGVGSEA